MSKPKDNSDNDIGKLIKAAGLRESVSPSREQRAHERVSAHWQSVVQDHKARRRPRQQLRTFAVAASVMLAVLVGYLYLEPLPEEPLTVASFARVIGSVEVDGTAPRIGDALEAGMQLRTHTASRVAMAMANGQILRVDENTELLALADDRLRLTYGAVYIDSADSQPSASVFVETDYGVAHDVGTQFQVRIDDTGLMIGVRDGLVNLARTDDTQVEIDSGWLYEMSTGGDDEIRPDDSAGRWAWVDTVVTEFDLDGATLHDYLLWYAREKGVQLEWADVVSEEKAQAIRLSGSIEDQSLDAGMQTVQRIAPFDYEHVGNTLRVKID